MMAAWISSRWRHSGRSHRASPRSSMAARAVSAEESSCKRGYNRRIPAEAPMTDSFKARTTLDVNGKQYTIWSLAALPADKTARLPYSLKILLENQLRFEDGVNVTRPDIEALLDWDPKATPSYEISFTPARVIMQDVTGVPCVADLAAMRAAITRPGGAPHRVNPLAPA